jgi:hypothetical protein
MTTPAAALQQLMAGVAKQFTAPGKNGVHMSGPGEDGLLKLLDNLVNSRVLVGIPEDKSDRKDGAEVNNAARLYIHEHGEMTAGIPARPTVMPGIADAQRKIAQVMRNIAKKGLSVGASASDYRAGLETVGQIGRDAIKKRINSNTPPPLAARTLQDRRKRGKMSTKTLVDEGEMRNAITYVVEKRP